MQRGFTLWFTGLSGAGKTTLANIISERLRERSLRVEILDGDVVREHLSKGLGFSREDRDTNILRIGFVCSLLARNGVVALASAISPYRSTRDQVREMMGEGNFVEVFVATPLNTCIARDVKGLYARAIAGTIKEFTGISDPYEPPHSPEIVIDTVGCTPEESATQILQWLEEHQYVFTAAAVGAASQ
jgi:adenylyl-sulfate kinase